MSGLIHDDGGSEAPGLAALERAVCREQEIYAYPDRPWLGASSDGADGADGVGGVEAGPMDPRTADVLDVLVVGGGQAGLTTAARLRREGVPRVLVVDAGDPGAEGPWVTWARMETLRTVKDLHGPDVGLPSATFRAWFTAQHGEAAWDRLDLIPREQWMAYLVWVRAVLAVPVLNRTRVLRAVPAGGGDWDVTLGSPLGDGVRGGDGGRDAASVAERVVRARRVVVCTGLDGVGGPAVPEVVADLPRGLWSHSSDDIDLARFAGGRVAVVGVGASAFDNAAAALEAGAREVVQLGRRPVLPTENSARLLESRAMYRHYASLPDEQKLALTRGVLSLPMPPPDHSVARCRRHAGYELRLGAPVRAARAAGHAAQAADDVVGVELLVGETWEQFDHLILATGFEVDLDRVPWLREVADDVLRWGDVHPLGDDAVDRRLARYPYLADGWAAQGRPGADDAALRHLYLFNAAALASGGPACFGINPLPWGSEQVASAVVRSLLAEEVPRVVEGVQEMVARAVAPIADPSSGTARRSSGSGSVASGPERADLW